MGCNFSTDGKLVVCGGGGGRRYHYFDAKRRYVLFCESLWYAPTLVKKLRRKKYERIDLFEKRVLKTLGFMPRTWRGWWQFVAVPQLRGLGKGKGA